MRHVRSPRICPNLIGPCCMQAIVPTPGVVCVAAGHCAMSDTTFEVYDGENVRVDSLSDEDEQIYSASGRGQFEKAYYFGTGD